MTETLPTPLTFAALRQAGIAHAQEASAETWTDYNLHDPGVTLLEQSCFALTELAYRADLPLRDLLTETDGTLDFEGLGLHAPDEVLRSAPVTLEDLETCLGALPEAARVHVVETGRSGLLRARVIPQEGVTDEAAVAAVGGAFAATRPLCSDLAGVEAMRAVPVHLSGRIAVGHRAVPERVAAEVWLRVGLLLRGTPLSNRPDPVPDTAAGADQAVHGATREDVAENPMRFEGRAPRAGATDRSAHIAALRLVPHLDDILALDLSDEANTALPEFRAPDADSYLALMPPEVRSGLVVEQDGVATALDPARMTQEIDRLRSEILSSDSNLLDPADWAEQLPGVPRSFEYTPVNATLPSVYTFRPDAPETKQLAGYRLLIDALLAGMTADLDHLPRLLSTDGGQHVSHWGHTPPKGAAAQLVASHGDWMQAYARHDRWHARRMQILDLLIALQGEEMPPEGRSGIDLATPAAGRAAAALQRRSRFLRELPEINRRRGTGPSGDEPGGALRKFLCLADLPVSTPAAILEAREQAGFQLLPDMAAGSVPRDEIDAPDDPLDLLLPDRAAPPFSPDAIHDAMGWLAESGLTPSVFARAALTDAWRLAPSGSGRWQVLFDAGTGNLYEAGDAPDRDAAIARASGLRAGFADLGRRSEGAWLLEDTRLRGNGVAAMPQTAAVVLPGWSLRMASPPYRRHVSRLLSRVAPAHCHLRPIWLDPEAFSRFAAAHAAWQADFAEGPALAALLAELERAE